MLGGLVGGTAFGGRVEDSYYYQDPDNGLGTRVTQQEMQERDTYQGWDFTGIWQIDEGIGYPYLSWE